MRHFLKSKTLIGGFPPAGHDKFALAYCPSFREVSLSSHVIMINERQKRTPYYVYIYLGGGWIRMKDEKSVSASGVPFFFFLFFFSFFFNACILHY